MDIRARREKYRRDRRKQLEMIANLKGEVPEDDMQLYNEFKLLRDRANQYMEGRNK